MLQLGIHLQIKILLVFWEVISYTTAVLVFFSLTLTGYSQGVYSTVQASAYVLLGFQLLKLLVALCHQMVFRFFLPETKQKRSEFTVDLALYLRGRCSLKFFFQRKSGRTLTPKSNVSLQCHL